MNCKFFLSFYQVLFFLFICRTSFVLSQENSSIIDYKTESTDTIFPRTDPKTIGLIYQMLKIIDEVFRAHDIPYWIDGGTALGAVRHKGCIPWDDDADLVFYSEDEARILALANEFASYGFCLKKEHILRLYPSDTVSYPFVDLAGYCLYPDNTLRFEWNFARLYFDQFYWLPDEVENLIRIPFGPLMLNAPQDMLRYLFTGYGRDCLTYATFQHLHNGIQQTKIFEKVRVIDFKPAAYEVTNSFIAIDEYL